MKTFLFIAAFLMLFHVTARLASSHTAPSGWSYDIACCNTYDCREVDGPTGPRTHSVQILEVTGGYRISTTNEFIPWNSKQIRDSKDEHYHWCSAGGNDNTRTICLYIPPRGY